MTTPRQSLIGTAVAWGIQGGVVCRGLAERVGREVTYDVTHKTHVLNVNVQDLLQ